MTDKLVTEDEVWAARVHLAHLPSRIVEAYLMAAAYDLAVRHDSTPQQQLEEFTAAVIGDREYLVGEWPRPGGFLNGPMPEARSAFEDSWRRARLCAYRPRLVPPPTPIEGGTHHEAA